MRYIMVSTAISMGVAWLVVDGVPGKSRVDEYVDQKG